MRRSIRLAALIGCVLVLRSAGAVPMAAPPAQDSASHWEHRAVVFGADEKEGTRILNRLVQDGWEYVGPLAKGLVAFKKYMPSRDELAARKELARWEGSWDGEEGV